ncbi:MAG: hypothetical protein QHH01_08265, partial [Spirochaetales bacterium]|nr:hypothetical protein [Spirochaetales bacterium]
MNHAAHHRRYMEPATSSGSSAPASTKAAAMAAGSAVVPESVPNVTGATQYIDDIPLPAGCLQAAVRLSESARGR